MKGIRKLFYGFVLLALFSVGFKIEAKANVTFTPVQPTQVSGVNYGDTTAGDGITATANYVYTGATTDFPNPPDSLEVGQSVYTYLKYGLETAGGTSVGQVQYICAKTKKVTATPTYEYYVAKGTANDDAGTAKTSAKDAVDALATQSTGGTIELAIKATKAQIDTSSVIGDGSSQCLIKAYTMTTNEGDSTQPNVAKTYSDGQPVTYQVQAVISPTQTGVSVNPTSKYLLPGKDMDVTISVAADTHDLEKKFTNWSVGGAPLTLSPSTTEYPTVNVKLNAGAGAGGTVTANYNTNVSLTFSNPDNITGQTFTSSSGTISRTYTFVGYTGANITGVEIDGNAVTYTKESGATGAFTAQYNGLSNATHTLKVKMNDGNSFTRTFTINDTTDVAIRSDGVAVTVGKSANISQFLTSGATRSGTVKLSGDADDYADINPSSGTYAVGSFKIVGVSAMKESKKNEIDITPSGGTSVKGRVTVYPKVSISTNSSGSSDSLNSGTSSSSKDTPLKVTVPAYVYYDNTGYKVSKAQIHFEGSDGTKTRSLDAPDSVSGTSWTVSVDSMKLSSILKDVCDGSSDEVKIKVWPYKGDDPDKTEGIGASTEIKAYKISLDGSGGAKYTINGEDVGDYFYAVKGTRYTIKATPKVAGDKFKNWDNNAFSSESGGDFTASESRTFKANYDSGSSSSSSSGRSTATNGESTGSGDYDDVPKTGESKTDIWILWSVLMISILGAGFMIWKRFGLARAIAEAEEQVAVAEHEEQVKAEKKAKKDKLDMLKDLRNL